MTSPSQVNEKNKMMMKRKEKRKRIDDDVRGEVSGKCVISVLRV
jgi:hypothetical protein